MTPKEQAAMQQVVDAWDSPDGSLSDVADAITALREALNHSGEATDMVQEPDKPLYRKVLREMLDAHEQAEQEPVAWLSEGGDVSRSKKFFDDIGLKSSPLYTHPVRTKDLTVKQICTAMGVSSISFRNLKRIDAVIAAFKEKNK